MVNTRTVRFWMAATAAAMAGACTGRLDVGSIAGEGGTTTSINQDASAGDGSDWGYPWSGGSSGSNSATGGTSEAGGSSGGVTVAEADSSSPNCNTGGPGLTTCGPGGSGNESCCTTLPVTGGTFYRTYTNNGTLDDANISSSHWSGTRCTWPGPTTTRR